MAMKMRVTALLMLALLTGCTLSKVKQQAEELGSIASVDGQVRVDGGLSGQVYAEAYLASGQAFELKSSVLADGGGRYQFHLLPGQYAFAAFIDQNGNAARDPEEPGSYLGMETLTPQRYDIEPQTGTDLPPLVISGPLQRPQHITVTQASTPLMANTGRVHSLDEPMFSGEAATMGLWRPRDFVAQYGGGLVFLEPYDPGRTPVLFVHGIGGSAREFSDIIASLDKSRFQAWVFQYPSGAGLETIAAVLEQALARVYAEHAFEELVLVAHSMGGLMSRDYVLKYAASKPDYRLALAVTINSPLLGMDSAAMGVKTAPFVLASWIDVATGSDFIRDVHATPWPADVPYHLVFSWLPGKEGDGVVPLKGQLSRPLQREAQEIHGFQAGHAAVLRDSEFIEFLNGLLALVER